MVLEGDYNLYGFFQTDSDGYTNFNLTSEQFPVHLAENYLFADLNISGFFTAYDGVDDEPPTTMGRAEQMM